jgi:hypothetical protein
MVMMLGSVVNLGLIWFRRVASSAQSIALRMQSSCVSVVAIGAAYAVVKHLALNERAVNVNLVIDLPIHVIHRLTRLGGPRLKELYQVMIVKVRPWLMAGKSGGLP